MPSPEFSTARNASRTCSCNGLYLHSRFDPEKEAERFVSGITCDYTPSVVVITGPCMSYTAPFLKKRWPEASLIAVQFDTAFDGTDSLFDRVFLCTEDTDSTTLSEALFSYLGEETAFSTLFVSWTPAEKVWPTESDCAWLAIRSYMNKARDVTGTRAYFNRRWMKNMVRFFSLTSVVSPQASISEPVIVCASGPTLQAVLPLLRNQRSKYFLLALSSAVAPLIHHDLIPDAVLSTDGGWWAMHHLYPLITDDRLVHVPLWITSEAAVPSQLLASHPVQYITYGDTLETWLLSRIEGRTAAYHPVTGLRNGTVSGTALSLARALTTASVFFCGLDLQSSEGYQHVQPNCLEQRESVHDCHCNSKEHRATPRTFSNGSLAVYRNWFATRSPDKVRDCARIISPEEQSGNRQLGNLQDISPLQVEQLLEKLPQTESLKPVEYAIRKDSPAPVTAALNELKKQLEQSRHTAEFSPLVTAFLKSAALAEYLVFQRDGSPEQSALLFEKADLCITELITLAEKLEGVTP